MHRKERQREHLNPNQADLRSPAPNASTTATRVPSPWPVAGTVMTISTAYRGEWLLEEWLLFSCIMTQNSLSEPPTTHTLLLLKSPQGKTMLNNSNQHLSSSPQTTGLVIESSPYSQGEAPVLYYRWRNWGSESNVTHVTQLVKS